MHAHRAAHPLPTPQQDSTTSSRVPAGWSRLTSARRQISLSNIVIPSFASFRAQSPVVASPGSVKRKPVPSTASSTRSSSLGSKSTETSDAVQGKDPRRTVSIDSVSGQGREDFIKSDLSPIPSPTSSQFKPRDLDRFPRGSSANKETFNIRDLNRYPDGNTPHVSDASNERSPYPQKPSPLGVRRQSTSANISDLPPQHQINHELPNSPSEDDSSRYSTSTVARNSSTLTMTTHQHNYDPNSDDRGRSPSPQPSRSPKRGWFGWNKAEGPPPTPSTVFSDFNSPAPLSPNPMKPMPGLLAPSGPVAPLRSSSAHLALDIPAANDSAPLPYHAAPGTPSVINDDVSSREQIEELERELKEVSSELANSIRREMELEDELERVKSEIPAAAAVDPSRRTSDYYSDSGNSSVRFPIGDREEKLEELERIRRQTEQAKANLKVEMGQRLQSEVQRRKELEAQLQNSRGSGGSLREKELEASLADAQRRLSAEKEFKENFEDLISAMRGELEAMRNERDNLKDEVVPQLRARVEGLETEASNSQKATYDMTKELEILKNARLMQKDMQAQGARYGGVESIGEDGHDLVNPGLARSLSTLGRSRSNTLARTPSLKSGLQRANSIKSPGMESPQALSDRVKDVEEQRDALHKALKLLLNRQEHQVREHKKRIKALTEERDRAITVAPHRSKFHSEVSSLKEEVSTLRKRADDAMEQKWQCEKGLSGLRMNLDRARQETSDLRGLLQEHDIPIPASTLSAEATNAEYTDYLDKAYKELRTTHALSLARVLEMESENGEMSAVSQRTAYLLKQSISSAEAERDAAISSAESYRLQARALQAGEVEHLSRNQSLAQELYKSASRMDELASQVEKQLRSNRGLRQRLTDAVSSGERDQRVSEKRIHEMQGRLRELEDRVTSAQQHTEEVTAQHDEELRQLKETHRTQLQRMKGSTSRSPARFSFLTSVPGSNGGSSPVSMLDGKSSRVDRMSSATGSSDSRHRETLISTVAEKSRSEELERRVRQLERAAKEAEEEMEEVVGRMNMAQIEVAELQAEKDEAMRQTRRLQAQIEAEREKVKQLMG